MRGHLTSRAHRHNGYVIDDQKYKAAVLICNVAETLPAPPLGLTVPPAFGLKVHEGFYCPFCAMSTQTTGSMEKHLRKYHSDIPLEDRQSYSSGPIQQLNSWRQSTWFRVAPSHTDASPKDLDLFAEDMRSLIDDSDIYPDTIDDVHNINSWLRSCGWHLHTKGEDLSAIRALVAPPEESELAMVHAAINLYVEEASSFIDSTHVLIRQHLVTEDDAK
jgi:hypothetical protein